MLAALCRARGIPARVAIGLVYVSTARASAITCGTRCGSTAHGSRLDATLARGGTGAAHLKLGDFNLKGTTAFSTFLPVAQVIGQLKIEILEVE